MSWLGIRWPDGLIIIPMALLYLEKQVHKMSLSSQLCSGKSLSPSLGKLIKALPCFAMFQHSRGGKLLRNVFPFYSFLLVVWLLLALGMGSSITWDHKPMCSYRVYCPFLTFRNTPGKYSSSENVSRGELSSFYQHLKNADVYKCHVVFFNAFV